MTTIKISPETEKATYDVHTAMGNDAYFIGDCYGPSPVAQEWEVQDTSVYTFGPHKRDDTEDM
jgi:hypothetical protein